MSRFNSLCSFSLVLAVAACGGSPPEPENPSPQPAAPAAHTAATDAVPMCQRIFARKMTCADDYLPMLVDLHVQLNIPPGFGDRVKSEGRDVILATAHTELARDTEPAKVTALCETTLTKTPPERVDQIVEHGARCEATSDCKAFAECVVGIDRGFIVAGARQH